MFFDSAYKHSNSAEAIVERPPGQGDVGRLLNFGSFYSIANYANGVALTRATSYWYGATMFHAPTSNILAFLTAVDGNSGAFGASWYKCY